MQHSPSIIGSWLTLFVATLEYYGVDRDEFLKSRGVDYERQSDPDQRIPLALMATLWEDAAALTGDPHIGLRAGSFVTPTTFSALGIALWSSCSIKDLLVCWCRYMAAFSTAADEITLREAEDTLVMTGSVRFTPQARASDYAIDATFSALSHLCRKHSTFDFHPLEMTLPRPQPVDPDSYDQWFGCPVSYHSHQFEATYDRHQAETPIPGGNRQLAQATEQLVADYLAKLQTPTLEQQLQNVLFERLPRGEANLENVASELHMSPRTLHRKLEEQGSSYRQELENVRRQLALQYMKGDDLSIGDIGFLLGFSNTSNFSRAFKRWTGQTPKTYRAVNSSPPPACDDH
ncbi:AraC family transcriptional regulator [Pseudomaricurvus alkylphenolicus]|jgi:AraC-like DNA-binding protein|uniref:AraC family transcriptional regulator n=1 Tax=Pseudomaricurvus alkylphenolicus TaxID=1306991 RepID=UPI001420A721|nr:AraC family transcriptional regulator [Pseudomaricurvus alkylphenolicus]NIB44281.1 AraC family transcriptional regulator [Pseudomaricurvus alkylphenolicus]